MSTGPGSRGTGRAWKRNWLRASERRFDSLRDDGEEALLLRRDVRLGHQHLRRAADRPEGVADLVGEMRGHLPDRGELLLGPHLVLQALDLGQVLEHEEVARLGGLGGLQGRDRDPDVDPLAVRALVVELQASEAAVRGPRSKSRGLEEPRAEDLAHAPAPQLRRDADRGSPLRRD